MNAIPLIDTSAGCDGPQLLRAGNHSHLVLPVKSLDQLDWNEGQRLQAAALRKHAAAKLYYHADLAKLSSRLRNCGRDTHAPASDLLIDGDQARFVGLKSCQSVWCCPICSAKVASRRKRDLDSLLGWARAQGMSVLLLTLTARHDASMPLAGFLATLKAAKERLRQRREFRLLRTSVAGSVTATEVTHGFANGWHPHFHEILLMRSQSESAVAAIESLRPGWLASLAGQGLSGERAAFQVQNASAAGDYIAKFGAAEEMTLQGVKRGRFGSRMPWQLLHDSHHGDRVAGDLWVTYAESFHGRRQLVWSPGLKGACGLLGGEMEPQRSIVLRTWNSRSQRFLEALRRSVALLRAAERGTDLDEAEFGPSDSERYEQHKEMLK